VRGRCGGFRQVDRRTDNRNEARRKAVNVATVEQPRIGARSGARMSQRTFSAWVALAAFLLLTLEEFLWGTAPIDGALTNILEHPDTRLLDRIGSLLCSPWCCCIVGARAGPCWRSRRRSRWRWRLRAC
jgi:hypothetical protein